MRVIAFERMWPQQQLNAIISLVESPGYMTAQRCSKSRVHDAAHGVDHLIMKMPVGSRGIETISDKDIVVVQIQRNFSAIFIVGGYLKDLTLWSCL